MQHINVKNISIFFACLLLLALGYYFTKESKKEYIGGNVLHLTYFTQAPKGQESVAPAWVNNGQVYHFLFDPLILANHDKTSFTPRIAQSYQVSENGLEFKFVIRNNLKWSDGESLTIDDVVYSLDLVRKLPPIGQFYDNAFVKIRSLDAKDNTLTITLNDTHSGFLLALSQFLIFPKHILENTSMQDFWENPVGSGMYSLAEKNERYYTLKINPHYTAKKPHIETILLHKDPTVLKDCYLTANIEDMENLRNMRGFTEYPLPVAFYRYFVFNIAGDDGHQNKAMQNTNLRYAIAKAIDNDAIMANMYSNMASPLKLHDPQQYNKEAAIELLEKSAYDLSRPLRLGYYYKDSSSIYFVENVAKYLQDIGFKIEYVVEDSLEDFYAKRHFDILFKDKTILHPTDWYLEHHSSHDSAAIFGHNGKYDVRVRHILQTQDALRQKELMENFNKTLIEDLSRYPVLSLNQAVYINSERLSIPANIKLGNPYSVVNLNIEDWKIKKN